MIHFREITTNDIDLVQKFANADGRPNCDFCFANIYGWQPLYKTTIAEYKGWLLFKFVSNRHTAFMMPINDGNPQCPLEEVVSELEKISSPHPLVLMGLTQEEAIKYHHEHWHRNLDDYIYSREALETLSGKHLQAKRNHVNKFYAQYPNARICDFMHYDECLDFARKWNLDEEQKMIERVIREKDALQIRGLELWIDDRLVAFTFGAPINNSCFDVMVEKADRDVEGAYAVINREFVKSLPSQYELINREEDLGCEGLRQAKLSYHPVMLMHKYSVWERV